jgi:hypothetical protein
MSFLVAAIHGILTNQTETSWPDRLDAWMAARDGSIKVLKKEYAAGPFPWFNCWFKDPQLAKSLTNEIELFLPRSRRGNEADSPPQPSTMGSRTSAPQLLTPSANPQPSTKDPQLLFVSHSNGAVIAMRTAALLIEKGYRIEKLILTGAAIEPDIAKNGILHWLKEGSLGQAIAYCSQDDDVLQPPRGRFYSALRLVQSALIWPYGCLGRTGWLCNDVPLEQLAPSSSPLLQNGISPDRIFSRFYPGGHSSYFAPENIEQTFNQIYEDLKAPIHSALNTDN